MSNGKNGIKRFSLVYEPTISKKHYVINFSRENPYVCGVQQVEYFKGIKDCKKGKSLLMDIDQYTLSNFESQRDFFESIGISPENKKLFIAFSVNGWINKLPVLFSNPKIKEKLKLVKADKFIERDQIKKIVDMLLNNDEFYNKFCNSNIYMTSTLKSSIYKLKCINNQSKTSFLDHESNNLYYYLLEEVYDELEKYHLYRGLFLLKQEYRDEAGPLRIIFHDKATPTSQKDKTYPEDFGQLVMPGFENPKQKIKRG